jgi:hypothetical protein
MCVNAPTHSALGRTMNLRSQLVAVKDVNYVLSGIGKKTTSVEGRSK